MESKKEYLTIAELAKEYPIGKSTVYLWAQQGRFPVIRIGRFVRVRRSSFEAFFNANESTSPQPA